jgi:hypothetical protein
MVSLIANGQGYSLEVRKNCEKNSLAIAELLQVEPTVLQDNHSKFAAIVRKFKNNSELAAQIKKFRK